MSKRIRPKRKTERRTKPMVATVPKMPALIGISGYFKGLVFPLQTGRALTVGRSRAADVSMRRTQAFRQLAAQKQKPDDAALTVSGKHFQVTLTGTRSIEVKNLSPNGTTLDGKPIETAVVKDFASRVHEIRFGMREVLRLEMRTVDE